VLFGRRCSKCRYRFQDQELLLKNGACQGRFFYRGCLAAYCAQYYLVLRLQQRDGVLCICGGTIR